VDRELHPEAEFMRAYLSVLIPVVLVACGGDSPPIIDPPPPVLTSVTVVPDTATLFTLPPGTSITLEAVARDENGVPMPEVAPAEFSGSAEAVATVARDGRVTAVSPGTAIVTAAMSEGEVTVTGTGAVTVRDAPLAAAVQAPWRRFEPGIVDVAAGGVVSWTIGEITHDVVFTTANAPENVQPTQRTTVHREFPTPGTYNYHCLLHSGMVGSVRVH
jgi:plastocyanin